MARAAVAARPLRPFTVFQRQRIVLPSADRTQAAAGIPAVGNHQPGAVALSLVFDLLSGTFQFFQHLALIGQVGLLCSTGYAATSDPLRGCLNRLP